MNRRKFLRLAASSAALCALWPMLPGTPGLLPALAAQPRPAPAAAHRRLIVIFLRGAVDGLSVVAPYADPDYAPARPSIALAPPGARDGLLDLDGFFGLHPALAPLLPLWARGELSFVHACGSPDPTRSHFDAQAHMESGVLGLSRSPDGWLNRLAGLLPSLASPARAMAVGTTLPLILRGRQHAVNMPLGRGAEKPTTLDQDEASAAFERLFAADDALGRAYREGMAARREIMAGLRQENMDADMGAPAASGFADTARRLARLMAQDAGIQLVFLDLGGFDTHVQQGAAQGQLAQRLAPLGEGLAALAQGLGPAWPETLVVVCSEFGRTVRENGNAGTDHGHGNALWLLGGGLSRAVPGGRVLGRWPGLAKEKLFEGRDLAVTTDFRHVLVRALAAHLGLAQRKMERLFPAMPPLPAGGL